MKIRDVMSAEIACCEPSDTLYDAVRLLWVRDCGMLPVVGQDGAVVGVLTDRDACMGSLLRGRRLDEIRVAETMGGHVAVCQPDDGLEDAASKMGAERVRRLPVVDEAGRLVGVVSMADLFRAADAETRAATRKSLHGVLARAMAAICEPRSAAETAQADEEAPPPATPARSRKGAPKAKEVAR